MKLRAFGFTTTGPSRKVNEDLLLMDNSLQLYVVADGMGGHVGGARAAQLAVQEVAAKVNEQVHQQEETVPRAVSPGLVWSEYFKEAVQVASGTVYREAQNIPDLRGMGTTLTSLYQVDDRGVIAHVGDTRLYLYRDGDLYQLTTDHTLLNDLVQSGEVSGDKVVGHQYAHVLSRAVGVHECVAVDTLVFDLALGDRFLLCSDGFYDMLKEDEDELVGFLSSESIEEAIKKMEVLPGERNASDNVSAAVLEVISEDAPVEEQQKSEEVSLKMEVLQQVSLFKELGVGEIVHLVQSGAVHRIGANSAVVEEGSLDRSLYVILSGEVSVTKNNQQLATLSKGNHFGEMSLLTDAPRAASVTAATEAVLLELPFELMQDLWHSNPRAGVEVLLSMSREFAARLTEANERN